MNFVVNLDWKLQLALGGSVALVVLACKIEPEAAEEALIHVIDAAKEFALAFSER